MRKKPAKLDYQNLNVTIVPLTILQSSTQTLKSGASQKGS